MFPNGCLKLMSMGAVSRKRYPRLPGITNLPTDFKIINVHYRCVEVERPDGFTVFFDRRRDKYSVRLNQIRLNGAPEEVIIAVGLVRGMQISERFRQKHLKTSTNSMRNKRKSEGDSLKMTFARFFGGISSV